MRPSIRSSYTEFTSSSAPIIKLMQRVQADAALALRDKSVLAQHNTIQLGSVVLLSGFLESFLRSVCESYFAELHKKGFGISALGDDFLKVHLREGAGHLADLVKRESKRRNSLSDSSAFVRRLVAPIIDSSKSPVWEAFARTQGNPSADVVKAILKGLGINGGFEALAAAIDEKYSANIMTQLLTSLNELRNESAHTGTTANVPQPSTIIDLVQFTRYLTLSVCRLVDRKVTELTAP
jgi:hypothetical protein